MDNDTTKQENTQLPRNALADMRKRADASKAATEKLWEETKAAEAEMLPAKRRYDEACSKWHDSYRETERLEAACRIIAAAMLEAKPMLEYEGKDE